MKILTVIASVSLGPLPGAAMLVRKEPQAVRSALLETSAELQRLIHFTGDPTGDLLSSVATLIKDTMMPGIISAHNSTQQQLDGLWQAFGSCPSPTTIPTTPPPQPPSFSYTFSIREPQDNQSYVIQNRAFSSYQVYLMAKPGAEVIFQNWDHKKYQPEFYWRVRKLAPGNWTILNEAYPQSGYLQSYENGYSLHYGFPMRPNALSWRFDSGERGSKRLLNGNYGGWQNMVFTDMGHQCKFQPRMTEQQTAQGKGDYFFSLAPTTTTTTTTTMLGGPLWIAAKMEVLAQCRQKEAEAATKYQDCQNDLSTLEGVKNSTCNSLKALETAPMDPSLCTPTDPYEQWLISSSTKVQTLKGGLAEKKAGCGNATKIYNDKVPECGALQAQYNSNKTKCDQLQAQAEAGVCAGPQAVQQETCKSYGTCYDKALSAFQEQEPRIKEMHLNWTVQWRTMKRMDCLLGIMQTGGTNEEVDKCKEKIWPTDHLDLAWPTIPDKVECGAASGASSIPLPCTADYMTKYYGNNPAGAPASTCTPCATSTAADKTMAA